MSRAKAVVLARGLGTRMKEDDGSGARMAAAQAAAADRGIKAMMPLELEARGTRPFLDYVLSALADAGYTDVCLVIGPDHDRVREYYTVDAPPRRVRVAFATQAEPRGTADALLAAESFAGADDVLVINGDNYYPVTAMRALRELTGPGTVLFDPDGLVHRGNIAADRIRAFAVGALTPDGYLADIVEKPDDETMRAMVHAAGGRALVSMNCWRLASSIFEACREVRPSARGELELTQAIRDAVRTGGLRVKVLTSGDGVLDLSRRGDIATVTAQLRGVRVDP